MNRRRFITLSGLLLGVLAYGASPLSPLPWRLFARLPGYSDWLRRRLQSSLVALVGEEIPVPPPVALAPIQAAAQLVAGLSRAWVEELFEDPDALRAHIEARQRQDLRQDRVQLVHGWLLSETEICLAALLSGGERS